MKIIHQGKKPEEKICRGTCSNCGTVVEYTVGEATVIYDQRDGTSYIVGCPTCRSKIYGSIKNEGNRFYDYYNK